MSTLHSRVLRLLCVFGHCSDSSLTLMLSVPVNSSATLTPMWFQFCKNSLRQKYHSEFPRVPFTCMKESWSAFLSLAEGSLKECLPSSPFSPEIFLVPVWVSFSNLLFLTVPGTLNAQVEPRQAIAVKLCHADFICMTHLPRKPEAQSVINFPSVFQFCHWHSFAFQLWK